MALHLSFQGEVSCISNKTRSFKSSANPLWTEGTFGTLLITAKGCVNSALKMLQFRWQACTHQYWQHCCEKLCQSMRTSAGTLWEPVVFCVISPLCTHTEAHTLSPVYPGSRSLTSVKQQSFLDRLKSFSWLCLCTSHPKEGICQFQLEFSWNICNSKRLWKTKKTTC